MKAIRKYILPGLVLLALLAVHTIPTAQGVQVLPQSDSLLNKELEQKAIYTNSFARNTFYTWTTLEQISQLRGNKVLLTKSKSDTKGFAEFDLALRDSIFKDNPVAKVLCEDEFAKKRFAWPNPWATLMGWEGEVYGNQLIKIVLKEDAIIGKFDETDKQNPFAFSDLKGNKIEIKDALAHKEKIAAIYHIGKAQTIRSEKFVGTYSDGKQVKAVNTTVPFREYVILNNAMIKYWAYGTDDITVEMNEEIALLNKVYDNCKNVNEGSQFYNLARIQYYNWQHSDDFVADYFNCICFENDFYLLNKKRIGAIISNMKKCVKAQAQPITGN
ncbi:MAG TPA: hypothetical protein VK806_05795 [Bacteroidia bacterium]|jgi:hypothetical protein|nr:hypothetical protein [Bacteroidia bacterium]